MENYKQQMDRITAPDTLRARIAALPQQAEKPKSGKIIRRFPRRIAVIAAVLAVILIGGIVSVPALFSARKSAVREAAYDADYSYSAEEKAADNSPADYDGYTWNAVAPAAAPTAAAGSAVGVLPTGRKLIRDADLNMQTKAFDAFLDDVRKKTAAAQGYTESASVSENYDGTRRGLLVLRIPADKLDTFLDGMEAAGTVTSRDEHLRDVTQEYVDTESRIRALETEQKTLLELMEKAGELSDVLEIQRRLSEVRASLESLKGQMQVLTNQIDYSSVTISVDEVKHFTPVEKKGFGEQLRANLSENLYTIGQGASDFALWFLSSLPYFILIALAAALIVVLIVLIRRRKRRKTQ